MILGQSIFDAVMARLKEEWEEENGEAFDQTVESDWRGVRGFNSSFIPSGPQYPEADAGSRLDKAYFAFTADDLKEPAEKPAPPATNRQAFDPERLKRLTPAEVAEDLGMTESDTAAILLGRRRKFARHNHPDHVPPEWREQANMRMKLANILIDEAIKRVKSTI